MTVVINGYSSGNGPGNVGGNAFKVLRTNLMDWRSKWLQTDKGDKMEQTC